MNLPNNTLLHGGTYRIIRFISSGGFGCTYEAEHLMLQKRVAIKEFFVKDFCNRDETTAHVTVGTVSKQGFIEKLRKKFIEEARALSRLSHPGIVRVSDVFEENGTAYFVMDYVEGHSLSDMVNSNGAMSESEATYYIRQLCDALDYVHSNNRLHLDIKPANVMVDTNGNAVLIDFGASKQYDEDAGQNNSTLLGMTPGYAPLEQMSNDVKDFRPATDIYSVGATFYKLLTGVTPPSASQLACGEKLPDYPTNVSPTVRAAIAAAMNIKKDDRPQTIEEFEMMLDNPIEETPPHQPSKQEPTVAYQPSGYELTTDDDENKGKSKAKMAIFITVAVLIAVIAGLVIMGKTSTKEEPETAVVTDNATQLNDTVKVENMQIQVKDDQGKVIAEYTYSGDYYNTLPNGVGHGLYKEGVYKGEYKDGIREGEGTYKTNDGQNYFEGKWHNNEFSEGKLTFEDGSYFVGKFVNNQYDTGTLYDKNGKPDGTMVNGVLN